VGHREVIGIHPGASDVAMRAQALTLREVPIEPRHDRRVVRVEIEVGVRGAPVAPAEPRGRSPRRKTSPATSANHAPGVASRCCLRRAHSSEKTAAGLSRSSGSGVTAVDDTGQTITRAVISAGAHRHNSSPLRAPSMIEP
jgi:hypothetical protein